MYYNRGRHFWSVRHWKRGTGVSRKALLFSNALRDTLVERLPSAYRADALDRVKTKVRKTEVDANFSRQHNAHLPNATCSSRWQLHLKQISIEHIDDRVMLNSINTCIANARCIGAGAMTVALSWTDLAVNDRHVNCWRRASCSFLCNQNIYAFLSKTVGVGSGGNVFVSNLKMSTRFYFKTSTLESIANKNVSHNWRSSLF